MASTLALGACAAEEAPSERLDVLLERVVDAGPGRGSPDYRSPDPLVAHMLAGGVLAVLGGADDAQLPVGTVLVESVDADGRPVSVVIEDPEEGARGLGAYAVRQGTGAPAALVVEVPHPRSDRHTEDLGVELFTASGADVLLVAGAHRTAGEGAADVAHEPASAFAAVDRAVVGPGTVVVQVHGFDESRHRGSSSVVLSSTEAAPDPLVRQLAAAFEDAGVEACLYDGEDCAALAGTRNVQGAHARGVGATFVHLELAAELRDSASGRRRVVEVLTDVLGE